MDNVQKTILPCLWQKQSAPHPFTAREKDLYYTLFYTHRHSLGKRLIAWDCITLPTELPPEKKNISQWRIKGTCTPGKLSQPYLLEGKISQDDRASLKTPENTEGCHFTSRAVCQTLKPRISSSTLTNPQGGSEGGLRHYTSETTFWLVCGRRENAEGVQAAIPGPSGRREDRWSEYDSAWQKGNTRNIQCTIQNGALIKRYVLNESLASIMKSGASVWNSCLSLMKQKWDQHSSSRESSKRREHLLPHDWPSLLVHPRGKTKIWAKHPLLSAIKSLTTTLQLH